MEPSTPAAQAGGSTAPPAAAPTPYGEAAAELEDDRLVTVAGDRATRSEEAQLLRDLGVDPHAVDEAALLMASGRTDAQPFGRPGKPLSQQSPLRIGFLATLGVGLAAALVWFLALAADIVILLVVAFFLATGLLPLVQWLTGKGLRRRLAITVVAVGFIGSVGGFLAFGVPPLVRQANDLRTEAPQYARDLAEESEAFARFDARFSIVERLESYADSDRMLAGNTRGLLRVAQGLLSALAATLTVAVLTLYLLSSYDALKRGALRLVPRSRRGRVTLLTDAVLDRVGGYMLGKIVTSVVAGIAAAGFLLAVGVPQAAALAAFVAVTDLIPLVGATIGAVVTAAVAATVSLPVAVATIVFFIVYQQFENFWLIPRVMESTVDVSALSTIIAALVGAALLGVLGALLAVPVAAAVQLVFREVVVPRQEAR